MVGRNSLPQNVIIEPTTKVLSLYDASKMKPIGIVKTTIRNPKTKEHCRAELVVVDSTRAIPLLGAATSIDLNLIAVRHENILHTDITVLSHRRGTNSVREKM